uniref:Uncharacterized protein n=1 Tax=Panagrellus redivivus TaxID=6233 RepID=A0A7E4UZR0_PANRE
MLGKLGESARNVCNRIKNATASIARLPSKKQVEKALDATTATHSFKADFESEMFDWSECEDSSRTNLVINTDDHTYTPLYAVPRRRKNPGKNKKRQVQKSISLASQWQDDKKSVNHLNKTPEKLVAFPKKRKPKKAKKSVKNQFAYKALKTSESTCSSTRDSAVGGPNRSESDHATFPVLNNNSLEDDDDGFVTSTSWEYKSNGDKILD